MGKPFNGPQYIPLIRVQAEESVVPAQTLPSGIVFAAEERAPYVPRTNKQQYLRGRQTKPFNGPQYIPLIQVQAEDSVVPAQTLPSGIVFAAEERAPYVPGTNKQQYLRGPQTNEPQYIPLIQVQAEDSAVPAQTLH